VHAAAFRVGAGGESAYSGGPGRPELREMPKEAVTSINPSPEGPRPCGNSGPRNIHLSKGKAEAPGIKGPDRILMMHIESYGRTGMLTASE